MGEVETGYHPENEPVPSEEVVLLLKPGAVAEEERLRAFFEEHAIAIEDRQERVFDRATIQSFYPHREAYVDQMDEHFSTGPTVALLVKGPNALALCLRMKHHVRGLLHLKPPADGLHSSDSPEEAQREKDSLGF